MEMVRLDISSGDAWQVYESKVQEKSGSKIFMWELQACTWQ